MFAARQGVVTRTATSTPGPSTLRRRRRRVCISASQIPKHVLDSLSSFRNFCSQSTRCQEFHGRQHSHRYQSKPTSSSSQSNVARKPHRQGYNARPGWNGSTSTTARTSQVGNFSSIDQEEAFLSLSDGFASPRVPYPDAKVASTSSSYARETADYSAFFDSVEESADSWDAKGKAKAVPRYHWSLRATSRLRGSQRKRFTTIREAMQTKRRLKPKLPECANEKDPFYKNIQAYTSLFTPAIRAELLQHEAVLKERLTEKTLEQLKAEGYCIDDMAGFWRGTLELGKHVAVFSLGPGITLPEGHRFEQGKQVLLSQNSPLTDKDVHRGTVMAVSDTQLKVYFEEERRFPLTALDGRTPLRWRLDLGQSNIVFERMEAAIKSLWHDPQQYEDESEYAMAGTHLRDILLKNFSPGADPIPLSDDPNLAMDQSLEDVAEKLPGEGGWGGGAFSGDARIQSWVNRYSLPVPLVMEGDMPIHNLNSSQIRAMASMIGNRLSLVQGPPGTGKTKTIIETLKLLKLHFQVPHPILVCTYTNVAVDNLVEGLAAAGVKPLRVGAVGSVRPSLLQHTLAAKLEAHPLFSAHQDLVDQEEKIKKELEEMHAKVHSAETELKDKKEGRASKAMIGRIANMMAAKSALERKEAVVKGKKNTVKQAMLREVTSEADVICSTCITSATYDLNVVDFPVVFLDEASMATEPVSLIPLMKGCQHLALIGDHRQLPPVILSKEAQRLGLGVSLFERLTKEGVVPSVMLDTQYRMHPDISNFPSNEFYLGTLRDGTVDEQGRVSRDLFPPMSQYLDLDLNLEKLGAFRSEYQYREEKGQGVEESKPRPSVIFLDHSGREGMKDKSRINRTEAHIIANVVVDLLLSNPVSTPKSTKNPPFCFYPLSRSIYYFPRSCSRGSRVSYEFPPWLLFHAILLSRVRIDCGSFLLLLPFDWLAAPIGVPNFQTTSHWMILVLRRRSLAGNTVWSDLIGPTLPRLNVFILHASFENGTILFRAESIVHHSCIRRSIGRTSSEPTIGSSGQLVIGRLFYSVLERLSMNVANRPI
ncbi:RNA helicase, variant 2 [Coprinopsis cinerea AmutBmut pab1-1]|nr:RNA helicase, variant 2 [Coprinopsis cinerea AmutBmut pab1-1]